jgi:hypothetical protein
MTNENEMNLGDISKMETVTASLVHVLEKELCEVKVKFAEIRKEILKLRSLLPAGVDVEMDDTIKMMERVSKNLLDRENHLLHETANARIALTTWEKRRKEAVSKLYL